MLLNRTAIAIVVAASAVLGGATAQSLLLSAAEARTELFGVRLSGVYEPTGEAWQECIEPSGRTVYRIAGEAFEGRLRIAANGSACFAYADDGYKFQSCFAVRREGRNYRFDECVTRRVERGVSQCEGGDGNIAESLRSPAG